MISALTGQLRRVDDDRIHVQAGAMVFELLVPAADLSALRDSINKELTFYTLLYFEGDSGGGAMEPRLLGFLRLDDKRFFEKFITVKGIGPKKALKALVAPVGDIAQAIESRDTRFLVNLPAIGKRMAELVVAELAGKVGMFALSGGAKPAAPTSRRNITEQDAIKALLALGERPADAERLLDQARAANPAPANTNDLIREMLRLRTA